MQNSVDAKANPEIIFERLDMNIGGVFAQRDQPGFGAREPVAAHHLRDQWLEVGLGRGEPQLGGIPRFGELDQVAGEVRCADTARVARRND